MKRTLRFAPLTLSLLFAASAHAQSLPYLDKYAAAPAALSVAPAAAPALGGAVTSWDEKRGVPTFFWAERSAVSPAAAAFATGGPAAAAKAYVKELAGLYRLSPAALEASYVQNISDTGRGGIIVALGQKVDGVEIYRTAMKVLLDRQGKLVAIGGNLHGAATPKGKLVQQAFSKGPAPAIAKAVSDAYGISVGPKDLVDLTTEKAGYKYFGLVQTPVVKAKNLAFTTPARAKKVLFAMPGHLVPAYYLEVDAGSASTTTSEMFGYVVAAGTGEILMRSSLAADMAFKYRVWSDNVAPYTPSPGPQADYCPSPTGLPDGNVPAFVAPVMTTMDGFNSAPGGGFDSWLPDAATVTTGNNVDAYADLVAPDGYTEGSDIRANTTAPQEFDRTYDVALSPASSPEQVKAAVTQLFYTTNWLHDYWYDSGFNEAAGNAQNSNFGRGGVEGDPLHVEGQDYSGKNNANMNTPADGASPRMQMYVWNGLNVSSVTINPGNLQLVHQDAAFGAINFNLTADVVLAVDGAGNPNDGCTAITNNVAGKIALVDRGSCTFETKGLNAQQAGAAGLIVANNSPNGLPGMGDDNLINGVTIPAEGISQADGATIKTALQAGTVSATMSRVSGPDVDGTIDGDTIGHEWGHYLHHRNVDCGGATCGGMSEGWADFDAIMMKIHEGDNVATGTFALSIYATTDFDNNGYFGIRRFPYTRDMTKNGLTLKHLTNGVAMPAGPIGFGGGTNFEVHNAGEIWAAFLFQGYTSLILNGGHPFDVTKRRMADYVVQGMKMAPPNPTMTEQRDGVLAAAAANDLADFNLLATAFAERGVGTCAVAPPNDSTDGSGVVEDFTLSSLPALVTLTVDDSVKTCDGDGFLDAEEIGNLHVKVRNVGGKSLAGTLVTVSSPLAGITFPNGNSVMVPDTAPFASNEVTLQVAIDNTVTAITDADFDVTLDNAASCNPSVQDLRTIRVNLDDKANSSITETGDSDNYPWTTWGAPGFESIADTVWSRIREANGNFRFYGQDFPAHADVAFVTPDLVVGNAGNFVVTFKHAYDFETGPQVAGGPDILWDGGLIEISTDGMTWQDVKTFVDPGYNGIIANIVGADNPLKDRPAFVTRNPAWPNTNTVALDFGTTFAGKTVKLRFRIGADAGGGVPDFQGWYLDDFSVAGLTNKPFHLVTVDPTGCNLAPMASAGADLVVDEGTMAALDATASSDPDNDALTYKWSQLVGPAVMLSSATDAKPTFTAPLVDADTPLQFQVVVDDGIHQATDTVNVLVKDIPVNPTTSGSGGGGMGGAGGTGTGGTTTSTTTGTGGGMAGSGGTGGTGGSTTTSSSSTGGKTTTSSAGGSTTSTGTGGDSTEPAGGCACDVAGNTSSSNSPLLLSLLGLSTVLVRRRRSAKK